MSDLVENIIAEIKDLPPFPKVAQKAMALLDDPDVGVGRLVNVAEMDSALTSSVLKSVNSAYYALPRRVDNIAQALTLLGNEGFREVVTTAASHSVLAMEQPGYGLSRGDLWRHSLATAFMSRILAERIKHEPGAALHTAALLHDIGKVILSSFVQDKVALILEQVAQGGSFLEAEQKVLGLDHARLGGLIARAWRFSSEMEELISLHHQPEQRPEWADLAILYLANVTSQLYGLGGGLDGLALRGQAAAMKLLELKEKDLEQALAELHYRLARAESWLEL